jgi:ABC-type lipoprotein release transport system permease subunit
MRRQRALLVYALGALVRRRGRNAAIVVGLTLVVGLFASVLFLGDALRAEVEAGARHVPDLGVQRLVAGRPALVPADAARAVADIAGVRAVTPRVWGYLFVPPISANVTVLGAEGRDALPPSVVAGRALRAGEHGACVLGAALAEALGVRAGDEIALSAAPGAGPDAVHLLRVVGTFRDASALRTADLLVTSDADARALLGVADGFATDLAVTLTTPDEARVATEKILRLVPGARVVDKERLRRAYALTLDGRSGLLTAALLPALAALLLLAWDRLTGLTETERRELGVLKAVGWEVGDVLTARVWESALVAVCGATLGVLGAYAYVFLAQAPGLSGALFGWSALYPPLRLTPQVDAAQTLALIAGVAVPFVAVGLVPAWRAATLDPDRALRGAA